MPNTPVVVGEGVISFALSQQANQADEDLLWELLSSAGLLVKLEEKQLDAATALAGCGPAFVYLFIEALADAGVRAGLSRDISLQLANQTLLGAAKLSQVSGQHPAQSPDDDTYYLDHNRSGKASPYGAIFSQSMNALDFSDPVTVLYGHNTDDPIHLFRSLHNFEDANFFAEHDVMYVFTPGRVFIYKIVAAYEYDDRHILNSFDFKNPQALQEYYNFVLNPDSSRRNIREGATLDAATDKILQLSTCMVEEYHGPHRFIVTGVLKDNRPIDSQSAINLSTL